MTEEDSQGTIGSKDCWTIPKDKMDLKQYLETCFPDYNFSPKDDKSQEISVGLYDIEVGLLCSRERMGDRYDKAVVIYDSGKPDQMMKALEFRNILVKANVSYIERPSRGLAVKALRTLADKIEGKID